MRLKSSSKDINVHHKRIKVGVVTLGIVFLCNMLFGLSQSIYEMVYFKFLFQIWRIAHDFTLGFLPIPSIYIIAPLFIGFFFYKPTKGRFWFLKAVVACLIWIVNVFYISWGYNYKQQSIYKTAEIEYVQLDSQYITQKFISQTQKLKRLIDSSPLDKYHIHYEDQIRKTQESLIDKWNIPTWGRVRVRKLFKGSLLHLRTSGIYIPHAFEGHLDNGLYIKQQPFTLAHEMAHGYGFTDESVCNFIAYLTCIQSDVPELKYSAELAYWRYLVGYYKYYHSKDWTETYKNLPEELKYDLDQISEHIRRYKDIMPKYRDIIYDKYLKTHGVRAGIRSYDLMIQLIASYEQKYGPIE